MSAAFARQALDARGIAGVTVNARRPYWRSLLAAYRIDGKRGTRAVRDFRAHAKRRPTPIANESAWTRSGLMQPNELSALRNARLLFLLPSASLGGGTKVVLTEARCLRSLGIDVWIANVKANRAGFAPLLRPDDPPTIYLDEFKDVAVLAREFDAVVATAWWTTEGLRALAAVEHAPTLAYYVQDFEPHFYATDDEQHHRARASYHLPHGSILFTKTTWNQQEVLRQEGVHSSVIGPSYDPDEFNAAARTPTTSAVRLCAMVRPETPRRAPELTLRVLKALERRYGSRLHVSIFGCTKESLDSPAFDTNFAFENHGVLDGREVAQLLCGSDIFLDLSTFQAMGLTAMEAMACGVAVIGPKRGGLGEIIEHGVSGLLIDTLDEAACVAAAAQLIEDASLRDELAAAGRRTVVQYTPDRAAARIARLLLLDDR